MRIIKTLEQINQLIENKIKENINLEYKRTIDDNALSKAISAFANTNGGQLIIGLDEDDDIATKITWVEKTNFRQTLNQWIQSYIQPLIHCEIQPIINAENQKQKIYIVVIEKGREGPYMAKDKKYYRRSETESIAMEHEEVMNAFFRSGLLDALIEEIRNNYAQAKKYLIHQEKFKNVCSEGATRKIPVIINPFKTEAWNAIIYSGLFYIVKKQNPELIALYNSIDDVNNLLTTLRDGKIRVATFMRPSGDYIFIEIGHKISEEIHKKAKEILNSFNIETENNK